MMTPLNGSSSMRLLPEEFIDGPVDYVFQRKNAGYTLFLVWLVSVILQTYNREEAKSGTGPRMQGLSLHESQRCGVRRDAPKPNV